MKPCPYRREHEFDDSGLCRHCYAPREEEPHVHVYSQVRSWNMDAMWCACGAMKTGLELMQEGGP